jgi:hypothetical protein
MGQQFDTVAAGRVIELQAPSMQKHPFEGGRFPGPQQGFIQFEIAILVVTHNGVAFAGEVNTDLMGTPGLDSDFKQRKVGRPGVSDFHQGD